MNAKIIFRGIAAIIYPRRCSFCGELLAFGSSCEDCDGRIKEAVIGEQRCPLCGCDKNQCCCKRKPAFNGIVAPFYYKSPVRECIMRFKFGGREYLAGFLAGKMLGCIGENYADKSFDVITCVPQTKNRRRERGFNQSALLAGKIARSLNVEFSEKLLVKLFDTHDQRELTASRRFGNVAGVFEVNRNADVEGKTVLLCDDVKTTGATLSECAAALRRAGASEVWCAVAAITNDAKGW